VSGEHIVGTRRVIYDRAVMDFLIPMVRLLVDALPDDERYVIHQVYWLDRSYGELAHRLEISWQLVRRTETNALARIERQLTPIAKVLWEKTPHAH
jgi:Sigma-70, region 4